LTGTATQLSVVIATSDAAMFFDYRIPKKGLYSLFFHHSTKTPEEAEPENLRIANLPRKSMLWISQSLEVSIVHAIKPKFSVDRNVVGD